MNKNIFFAFFLLFVEIKLFCEYEFPASLVINKSPLNSLVQFVELKIDHEKNLRSAKLIPSKKGFRILIFDSTALVYSKLKYELCFKFFKNNRFSFLLKEYVDYSFGPLGKFSFPRTLIKIPSLDFNAYRIASDDNSRLVMWIRSSDKICLNVGSLVNYVIDAYNKGMFSPEDLAHLAFWRKYLANFDSNFLGGSKMVIQVLSSSREEELLPESQSLFEAAR